ncbi:MAG: zinc-binding dehydrogenase, partial [Actinomycetota bacterium]|nr:zinc-binding dehydrogenase [Actinomycetota bacterium]
DGPGGKSEIVAGTRAEVWPLIANGQVQPIVHTRLPMADAAAAHRLFDDGGVVGKVLLLRS